MIKIENGHLEVKGDQHIVVAELITIIDSIGAAHPDEESKKDFCKMLKSYLDCTDFTSEGLDALLEVIASVVEEDDDITFDTIEDIIENHNNKIGGQK